MRSHSAILLLIACVSACSIACVTEGPTKPSPVPPSRPTMQALGVTSVSGDDSSTNIQGGKACVLTPADPVNIQTCTYTCPNGITFSVVNVGYPVTSCPRVTSQPKKN